VTPELIAAVFTGLTGFIAALAAFTANRSRRVAADQRTLRKRVRILEKQVLALVEHTFVLELEIARTGGRVPDRPPVLESLNDDDEDDETPAAAGPSHRRA
jgi:hypothetical protein